MESEFKDTLRYFNTAYVKRFYGKWIASNGMFRKTHTLYPIEIETPAGMIG